MPYSLQLFGKNRGVVYNTKTGHSFSQKPIHLKNAKKQEHLLQAIEHNPKFIPLGQHQSKKY
jgi:hypothetical protein